MLEATRYIRIETELDTVDRRIVGCQGETHCSQGRNLLLLGKPLVAKEETPCCQGRNPLLPRKKPLVARVENDLVTMDTDKMTKSIDTTEIEQTIIPTQLVTQIHLVKSGHSNQMSQNRQPDVITLMTK